MSDVDVPDSKQIVEEIRRILPPELVMSGVLPRDPAVVRASMKGMPLGLMRGDAPPRRRHCFRFTRSRTGRKAGPEPARI